MRIIFFIESLKGSGKERRFTELIKGLHVIRNIEFEIVLMSSEIHYQSILDLPIKIHILKRRYTKKDPLIFYRFFLICKAYKPDLIHVWGNMVAFYALPAKLLGIPILNGQITNANWIEQKSKWMIRLNLHFANMIVSNSHAGIKAYPESKSKSIVIQNGFDFNRLNNLVNPAKIKSELGSTTKHIVMMVASYVENKDYPSFISAAQIILEEYSDVTFVCIGKGDHSSLKKLISSHNVSNIKFLNSRSDIESYMNVADVGVLSSFAEGIPNTILEFMALGKPVVASDGGGIREIVINDHCGYLVPQQSPKLLASKILLLLKDDFLRLTMGVNARNRVSSEFNLDKMVLAYTEVYKNLTKISSKNSVLDK